MVSVNTYEIVLRIMLLMSLLIACSAHAQDVTNYRLDTGDSISIEVFQEEDLTVEKRVSDIGTIAYPLLGTINAAGLTLEQLEEEITQGLKGDYLVNPRVNISIAKYRNYYVNGEVESSGAYAFVPGMTVRKAITIAGGFAVRADKDDIFILRENAANEQPIRATLGTRVEPGDIITVEQSFF